METNEHKQAGDQIRIETLGNPYLQGSNKLLPEEDDRLLVTMMQQIDDVPVPLELQLTAGDIVALAGDYYTKAGWGLKLNITSDSGRSVTNKELFSNAVSPAETNVFKEAYSDLASPDVSRKDIAHIYQVEETTYIPFFKSLNATFQQLVYSLTVKDYGKKLTSNEAHFAPWSARAYIVGHNSALEIAELALNCQKLATGKISLNDLPEPMRVKLTKVFTQIQSNPKSYRFNDPVSNEAIYTELAARYHALAVAQDLFAMHFYSDHFAGGHLSRIGLLRKTLPEQFGVWGSILINNMHNEDNTRSVIVTNSHQPDIDSNELLKMYPVIDRAYGDGTYFKRSNNDNSDMLVNGMTNSLGDIARIMQNGIKPSSNNYGGLCFLPEIDLEEPQTQPLLIHGKDGNIYSRANLSEIKTLDAKTYQATLEQPQAHGYDKLTYWKAFILVFKLRVLGFLYSPQVQTVPSSQDKISATVEEHHEESISKSIPSNVQQSHDEIRLGQWRSNPSSVLSQTQTEYAFFNDPLVDLDRSSHQPPTPLLKCNT